MSILDVNGNELMNAKSDVDTLLNDFNSTCDAFYQKLNELNNYWIGEDYLDTKNNVEEQLKPLLDKVEGSVPRLLKEISNELETKATNYANIQKENMREDF